MRAALCTPVSGGALYADWRGAVHCRRAIDGSQDDSLLQDNSTCHSPHKLPQFPVLYNRLALFEQLPLFFSPKVIAFGLRRIKPRKTNVIYRMLHKLP